MELNSAAAHEQSLGPDSLRGTSNSADVLNFAESPATRSQTLTPNEIAARAQGCHEPLYVQCRGVEIRTEAWLRVGKAKRVAHIDQRNLQITSIC
jgi:hypothetical protein